MPSSKELHPTSVRLDRFQRTALGRIARLEQRSLSFLIQRAIDRYVEEELDVSRRSFERVIADEAEAQLLASWKPRPYRVPTDEELQPVGE